MEDIDDFFPIYTSNNFHLTVRHLASYLIDSDSHIKSQYKKLKSSYSKERFYIKYKSNEIDSDPVMFFNKKRVTPYLLVDRDKWFWNQANINLFNKVKKMLKIQILDYQVPIDPIMRKFHNK